MAETQNAALESLTSANLLIALTSSQGPDQASDLLKLLKDIPQPDSKLRKPTPLHMAVRCGRTDLFPLVLDHRAGDLNIRDSAGQTPAHIASALGRSDLIKQLLAHPGIDDSIRDDQGRTCFDLAATPEVSRLIQASHSHLNATFLDHLAAYVSSGQTDGLVPMLRQPRAKCIDFSNRTHTSPHAGTTIMHEAARRKDIDMLRLSHDKGADVLVRDARGKTPVDYAKDDKTRAWFKQVMIAEGKALRGHSIDLNTTSSSNLSQMSSSFASAKAPPPRRGYLQKWTNLARGYKNRWFVLQNGQLSYYRHQSEEGKASRGTIAMNHAKVAGPPPGNQGEANKFEITSEIAKFRFFVKADHPLEAIRWVEDLKAHIDYASGTLTRRPSSSERNGSISSKLGMSIDLPKADMSSASVGSMTPNVIPPTPLASKDSSSHIEKRSTAASNEEKSGSSSISATLSRKLSTSTLKKLVPGKHSSSHLSSQSNNLSDASSANLSSTSLVRSSHGSSDSLSIPMLSSPASLRPHDDSVDNSSINSLHEENLSNRAPHEENFMLLANSAKAQVETTSSLLATLNVEEGAAADAQQVEVVHALRQSVKRVQAMLEEYVDQVTDREKWFCRRYEAEIEARQLWEDNLTNLAKQHVELEQELQKEAQKGSRRKKELRNLQARGSSPSLTALNSQPTSPKSASKLVESREKDQEVHGRDRSNTIRPPQGTTGVGVGGAANANEEHVAAKDATYQYVEESSDEEDDEFFEAVEAGTLDMSVDPPLTEPPSAVFHEKDLPPDIKDKLAEKDLVYAGYMNPRTELPIGVDDRPNVSLWSILKNSIGKDLTKISFPVSFNEPTSMLQRMAEDMEFSEVLDAAVMHKDPAERIAFVAAFAMSNYSSTIGRIAKPFNPMLSETFEYVSVDKRYRYMSEQVSHHPPISACIAESPNYRYFGEVDAKNKFMGKSFEIRPTGVAHCELRLPTETAPDYPADDQGLASEHYSWKKVTSSVSNFIWGSPIIDHYGDMVVTNHRTGDTCTLTFKPRGWKGSNTSEIKGKVVDGSGKLRLDIAGRWSTQLVARRAGEGSGELQPDAPLSDQPEYILLWKNSEKPANSPFNLTPYAITLNGKDDSLVPWLPPTDCRLRPDLHAFEAGKFEEANTLKIGLEEIQRTTRRNRETGELPPHRPRWFTHMTEGDTQEGYWKPSRLSDGTLEYWTERERVGKAKVQGQDAEWTNVTPIFGDYALL